MVSIGDMLAATDRLGAPDTPGGGRTPQPSFYVACSRFLPGTNMKTAAHLMYLHMHHHLKLGFQARPWLLHAHRLAYPRTQSHLRLPKTGVAYTFGICTILSRLCNHSISEYSPLE